MNAEPGTGRGARPIASNEEDGAPAVRQQQPVPAEILALSPMTGPDYVDAFTMTGGIPGRSPEQWARAMFEDVAGINLPWRVFLGLHLRVTPERVSGWDITERGHDWIRLEVTSWLWTNHLVVQADDDHVTLATFVRYDRPLSSRVWLAMSTTHRREAPRLLRGARGSAAEAVLTTRQTVISPLRRDGTGGAVGASTTPAGVPRRPRNLLRWLLAGSGLVAVGTGSWVVARGTAAIPAGGVASPSADSVLRFYATWWSSSGLLMLSIASEPERHPTLVRGIAAATLTGGVARLLAVRQSGWPHPLFRALTVMELVTSPFMLAAQRRSDAPSRSTPAGRRPRTSATSRWSPT